jgi:hypothetical protein
MELNEDAFPAAVELDITVPLKNPPISPPRNENLWKFKSYTAALTSDALTTLWTDDDMVDCNLDVERFKIYGEFRSAFVASSVSSPTVENLVGIRFVLESELPDGGDSESSKSILQIYLPRGFEPLRRCGIDSYALSYDPLLFTGPTAFPEDRTYVQLPSGTTCKDAFDDSVGLWYIEIEPDGILEYGLDYAFMFGMINAGATHPTDNVWRFQTKKGGVVLHLVRGVPSFGLQELQTVAVFPADTTKLVPLTKLEIQLTSEVPLIPGGSKITIVAPGVGGSGFLPTCGNFDVQGLAKTTTCSSRGSSITFTVDTQNAVVGGTPISFHIHISNPEFTPQPNNWSFFLVDADDMFLDIKERLPGYDITGPLLAGISTPTDQGGFPYH